MIWIWVKRLLAVGLSSTKQNSRVNRVLANH